MQASLQLSAQRTAARPSLQQRTPALCIRADAAPTRPGGGASRAANPPPTSDVRTSWGAAFETSSRPSGAARDIFKGLPASSSAPGYNSPDPAGARPGGRGRNASMSPNEVRPASPISGPDRPSGGGSRNALFASVVAQETSLGGGNGGGNSSSSGGGGGGNGGSGSVPASTAAAYGLAFATVCGVAVAVQNNAFAAKHK